MTGLTLFTKGVSQDVLVKCIKQKKSIKQTLQLTFSEKMQLYPVNIAKIG